MEKGKGGEGGTYRINLPQVASQVVEGEALLIHFDSGRYYSADGSGGLILSLLERGHAVERIVDGLAVHAGLPREEVGAAVRGFVRELLEENLIVPDDGARAAGDPQVGSAGAYVPPALRKYTELQDLLRLDPIHDVDDAGWPIAKT